MTILVLLTWFDLLPVIAGLGVILAALTLAGQSIVLDYLMGILIVVEGPYYKGDWIQVGGVEGEVEEVGLRRTMLRDTTGTVHSVSNGEIRIASNLTRVYARMQVDMTVAFGTDLDLVTRVVNEVGQAMADDPAWRTACSRCRRSPGSRRWATSGSRSGSPARSGPPIAGPRPASCASACWPRSRPTASRSRGRRSSVDPRQRRPRRRGRPPRPRRTGSPVDPAADAEPRRTGWRRTRPAVRRRSRRPAA